MTKENFGDRVDQLQFEADFEMAVDMFEFALEESKKGLPGPEEPDLFQRFKKSKYKSAQRLRL